MVEVQALTRIGYWRGDRAEGWPEVTAFVDSSWDPEERDRVAAHLRRGMVVRAYLGFSTCRICGQPNGSVELTDGTYVWPEGLAHYIETHEVRLPERFTRHVGKLHERLEDAEVDDRWWREAEPDWS